MLQSPHRKHDRQSFFKYMSAATAKLVLAHRTLRWSSPCLFNDPFDVPRELSYGIEPADIMAARRRRFSSLVENPPEDTSDLEPKVRLIVDTLKQKGTPDLRAELIAAFQGSETEPQASGEGLKMLRDLWRSWIPEFRILCLAESPKRVSMWFHYADQYKGAVLEFQCVEDLDSAWLRAQPVTYPTETLEIFEADGWAKLLMMPSDTAKRRILHVATYTKSPDWSYENEWRITSFRRSGDNGLYTDYKFSQRELASMYLGPLIAPEDRDTIIALAEMFPHVRVFDVSIGMNRAFVIKKIRG